MRNSMTMKIRTNRSKKIKLVGKVGKIINLIKALATRYYLNSLSSKIFKFLEKLWVKFFTHVISSWVSNNSNTTCIFYQIGRIFKGYPLMINITRLTFCHELVKN